MKRFRFAVLAFLLFVVTLATAQTRGVAKDAIPGDNNMRYYRLALPVTLSAYEQDLGSDYNNVLSFWRECEEFANRMFVPLGICFDVVEDSRLVMSQKNMIDDNIYNVTSFGTELTNAAVGSTTYDVGMWVHHRGEYEENSGLSVGNGAYNALTKSSGYAKTDRWVVAHELGHMFGADFHTAQGEGSLMDNEGEFFSYPSILLIREESVNHGTDGAYTYKSVTNSAPVFDTNVMKDTYRIPQGACIAIPVSATDEHIVTYSAIGCSSANINDVNGEDGYVPHFCSLAPQEIAVIDYSPKYRADINDANYYFVADGTNVPSMSAGSYPIAILANDMPAATGYDYLTVNPFYSNYSVWDATVQIVGGTAFNASLTPQQNSYSAGETVTVKWGVNSDYFTSNSRVRITMSTNYGQSYDYVLAESVPATGGSCAVVLPNVNVGSVDVDFVTATRSMRGGIIKVEEIGGVAYTLTTLSPANGGGFTVTGGGSTPDPKPEPEPTPTTYTVTTTANPADGGTAKFAVGTGSQMTQSNIEDGTEITLYATANTGYKFVNWTLNGSVVGYSETCDVKVEQAANYVANFEAEAKDEVPAEGTTLPEPEYQVPTGNTYQSNYLTSASTTGAIENVEYEAKEHPNATLVKVPGTVRVKKGESFTLNLVAYSLGAGSSSTVYEDMRYCHASLFTDFDCNGSFDAATETWGNQPPQHNVYGNYDQVMNISATITVPADAPFGTSHVRMVYTNAWSNFPAGDAPVLDKGIVYDFVVEVVETVAITASASTGGSVTINNEAIETKSVVKGSEVTLTATPQDGYEFVNWTKDGAEVSSEATYAFVAAETATYVANFKAQTVQPDPLAGKYFRLKAKNTDTYMNIYDNDTHSDGAKGGVNVAELNASSDNQIFQFIKSGSGYMLQSATGYYINCQAWNVDANSTTSGAVLTLTLEPTENQLECLISCDKGYFKIDPVKGDESIGNFVYCDAQIGAAAIWVLEKVEYSIDCTVTVAAVTVGGENGGTVKVATDTTDGESLVVNKETKVTFTVLTTGTDYRFAGWYNKKDECVSTDESYSTIVTSDISYYAKFIKQVDVTIEMIKNGYAFAHIGDEATLTHKVFDYGTKVEIYAVSYSDDARFAYWTLDGVKVSQDAYYSFDAREDSYYFVANFSYKAYIAVVAEGNGTVYIGSEGVTNKEVATGNEITITAKPEYGYALDHWVLMDGSNDGEGTIVRAEAEYTFVFDAVPNMTVTYKAFFKRITALEDGKSFRIAGKMGDGTLRYIYRDGTDLKWSNTKDETDNSIFVAQSNGFGSFRLISALGDYAWSYDGNLGALFAALDTDAGTKAGTFTLYAKDENEIRTYNASGTSNTLTYNTGTEIIEKNDDVNCTDFVVEEVEFAFKVGVADGSNAKLGTINLPFATTVPAAVTAYHVVKDEEGYVYVDPLELKDNILPANTPVLIEAEAAGKYDFVPAPASQEYYSTGFEGTLAPETIAATTNAYILSYDGAGTRIKFYKLSSTNRTINANKAYYNSKNFNPAAFYINLGSGTTGLEEVKGENGEVKTIYDLQGRKLSEIIEPGIYIVDGKKVWVK